MKTKHMKVADNIRGIFKKHQGGYQIM